MDLYSFSNTPLEVYYHPLILTDGHGEFRWQYGIKIKDEALAGLEQGKAETAEIKERNSSLMMIRDNICELLQ